MSRPEKGSETHLCGDPLKLVVRVLGSPSPFLVGHELGVQVSEFGEARVRHAFGRVGVGARLPSGCGEKFSVKQIERKERERPDCKAHPEKMSKACGSRTAISTLFSVMHK